MSFSVTLLPPFYKTVCSESRFQDRNALRATLATLWCSVLSWLWRNLKGRKTFPFVYFLIVTVYYKKCFIFLHNLIFSRSTLKKIVSRNISDRCAYCTTPNYIFTLTVAISTSIVVLRFAAFSLFFVSAELSFILTVRKGYSVNHEPWWRSVFPCWVTSSNSSLRLIIIIFAVFLNCEVSCFFVRFRS